jgi:hypothetical protein
MWPRSLDSVFIFPDPPSNPHSPSPSSVLSAPTDFSLSTLSKPRSRESSIWPLYSQSRVRRHNAEASRSPFTSPYNAEPESEIWQWSAGMERTSENSVSVFEASRPEQNDQWELFFIADNLFEPAIPFYLTSLIGGLLSTAHVRLVIWNLHMQRLQDLEGHVSQAKHPSSTHSHPDVIIFRVLLERG